MWTVKKPRLAKGKDEGLYWYRGDEQVIVKVFRHVDDHLYVLHYGSEFALPIRLSEWNSGEWWSEPIDEP